MNCPLPTYDVKLNLKNRDWAFKNVGYGPANTDMPNAAFWADKADQWQTDLKQAKNMRCGNCAAFIQTPEMLQCIHDGIDKEENSYAGDVMETANLGFCELFDFKCAGTRTCSAWLVGGPIISSNQEVEEAPFSDTTEENYGE